MRHTGWYGSGPLAVTAMAAAILAWPMAGEAQTLGGALGTTSGLVGTTTGTVGNVLGTTTVLADTGTLIAGTSDALQASQVTGNVPSLLTGEVLHAVTIGYPDQIDSEASLAALNLNVAGISIGADFVMARTLAVLGGGAAGTSNVVNLAIDGVPTLVTGDPNQTIGIVGGVLVINEQQVLPDGTTVVNALHAIVYGVADVVVASATAGAGGGNAKAVQASF
jgi:hypothetical protein